MHPADYVFERDELLADTSLFDDLVKAGAKRVERPKPPPIPEDASMGELLELLIDKLEGNNPLDPQARLVYEAEDEVYGGRFGYCEWTSFDEVESFIRKVETSEWWTNAVGDDKPPLRIAPTSKDDSDWYAACSQAAPDLWAVELHPAQWGRATVIHELAHVAIDYQTDGTDIIGHGPKWVRCYLDGLYSVGLIGLANSLRAALVKRGVEIA